MQRAGPNASPIPGSTVSWLCNQIDSNGNVIPGFADGLNGGVIIPIGISVLCTAVNQTSELTLVKSVVNTNGGAAVSADWSLTATPSSPKLSRPDGTVGCRLVARTRRSTCVQVRHTT